MKDLSFLDDDAIADLGLDDPDVEDDGRALPGSIQIEGMMHGCSKDMHVAYLRSWLLLFLILWMTF